MFHQEKTSAAIVADALVVSFRTNNMPKVWRADLVKVSSAVFEIVEANGTYKVVLRAENKTEDIAVFPSQKKAAEALSIITDALMLKNNNRRGFFTRLVTLAKWITIIAIVVIALIIMFVPPPAGQGFSSHVPVGVPVPAEEILGGPQ